MDPDPEPSSYGSGSGKSSGSLLIQIHNTAFYTGLSPQSVELTAPLSAAPYSPPLTLSTPVPPKPAAADVNLAPTTAGAPPPLQLYSPMSLPPAVGAAPNPPASTIKRPVYAPDPFMNPGGGGTKPSAINPAVLPPMPPSSGGLHYSQSTVNFGSTGNSGSEMHTSYSSPNLQVGKHGLLLTAKLSNAIRRRLGIVCGQLYR
jgi:hypothetical protein